MYRVIFEHHPTVGMEKAFIEQWQKGSDIIQTYPGARGTLLFRSLTDPKVLYAMAEWESKVARDAAMTAIAKRDYGDMVRHGHLKFVDAHSTLVSAEMIAASCSPDLR